MPQVLPGHWFCVTSRLGPLGNSSWPATMSYTMISPGRPCASAHGTLGVSCSLSRFLLCSSLGSQLLQVTGSVTYVMTCSYVQRSYCPDASECHLIFQTQRVVRHKEPMPGLHTVMGFIPVHAVGEIQGAAIVMKCIVWSSQALTYCLWCLKLSGH